MRSAQLPWLKRSKKRQPTWTFQRYSKKSVFGDNTTIVFGTCNNTQVTNSLIKNDKTALADELRKNGVEEEDIAALDIALAEDPVPTASGQYRSAVQGWMKPMPESAEV